jgi:hypothetical protein
MLDIPPLALMTADELQRIQDTSMLRIQQFTDANDPQSCFRTSMLRLTHPYSRLVVLSLALQQIYGQGSSDERSLLLRVRLNSPFFASSLTTWYAVSGNSERSRTCLYRRCWAAQST